MDTETVALIFGPSGFLALLTAALGLGVREQARQRKANLDGWTDANIASMERERSVNESHDKTVADIRAHHASVVAEIKTLHAQQLSVRDSAIVADRAEADVRIATLNGRLAEVRSKADKYDAIFRGHEVHLGGKADVHGRGVELLRECPCGKLRFTEPAEKEVDDGAQAHEGHAEGDA